MYSPLYIHMKQYPCKTRGWDQVRSVVGIADLRPLPNLEFQVREGPVEELLPGFTPCSDSVLVEYETAEHQLLGAVLLVY